MDSTGTQINGNKFLNASDIMALDKLISEKIINGNPGIIFVSRIQHGVEVAAYLTQCLGASIPLITGKRTVKEKELAASQLQCGELPCAVATSTWSVGVNIPNLRWIVLLGDDAAPLWLIQSSGRGTRLHDGKCQCEIINVVRQARSREKSRGLLRTKRLQAEGYDVGDTTYLCEPPLRLADVSRPTFSNLDTSLCSAARGMQLWTVLQPILTVMLLAAAAWMLFFI